MKNRKSISVLLTSAVVLSAFIVGCRKTEEPKKESSEIQIETPIEKDKSTDKQKNKTSKKSTKKESEESKKDDKKENEVKQVVSIYQENKTQTNTQNQRLNDEQYSEISQVVSFYEQGQNDKRVVAKSDEVSQVADLGSNVIDEKVSAGHIDTYQPKMVAKTDEKIDKNQNKKPTPPKEETTVVSVNEPELNTTVHEIPSVEIVTLTPTEQPVSKPEEVIETPSMETLEQTPPVYEQPTPQPEVMVEEPVEVEAEQSTTPPEEIIEEPIEQKIEQPELPEQEETSESLEDDEVEETEIDSDSPDEFI